MTQREPLAPRLFRIGDVIPAEKGGIGGEIVALRDLSAKRQQVYFRHGNGGLASMTVELDASFARVVAEPVSEADACNLAYLILSGRPPHTSVTTQLNILAAAVMAAREAKGENS